jgi:hypothetical protein
MLDSNPYLHGSSKRIESFFNDQIMNFHIGSTPEHSATMQSAVFSIETAEK